MVGDVPMSPVVARLPPTFTLTAPTATSANTVDVKPGEGPVICQELARTQVEDVPLPRIDTSAPSTSARAQAATSMAITTGAVDLLPSQCPGGPPDTVRHTSQLLLHTGLSQPMDCLHLRDYAVPLGASRKLDSLASRHRRTTLKPSRKRRITRFRSGRRLLINARHGTALHPSEEGSLPSEPKTSASEPEYMRRLSALARVDGLGTVPVAVGSSASASAPVYVVVGGVVGNQIGEAQWSAYARTSPTSTSADATIATDTVGDEPSEVHPTAGVVADELLRGQVEASMPPVVDARIPPASGPDATATDVVDGTPSGTPPATVLVADAFDCGRVEVVPLPIAPANIPSTLASAATTVSPAAVAVGYDSARSQVEDVPMPFVQVMISLGSVSASASAATTPTTANAVVDVLGEVPPAIMFGVGESACSMVDDVPMYCW